MNPVRGLVGPAMVTGAALRARAGAILAASARAGTTSS